MTGVAEWGVTLGIVVGLMVFDFWAQMRSPHEPTFRQSVKWTGVYVAVAVAFGASMLWWREAESAKEYLAGYVTEWSLSVDNLFVFLLILTRFRVPKAYRQRVLLFGVAIALVLRGLFIWAGATALSHFSWLFYLFGAFLVWTAISVARKGPDEDAEYHENRIMRGVRRVLPSARGYHGGALIIREGGRRLVTPLVLVMVAIGTTDIFFALDSIPAIFGLTTDPFIVFAANAFALMGLRQLFFLVQGLLDRLVFLGLGLAVILAFIGTKLVFHALHVNALGFINGGRPIEGVPEISIEISLSVILATLVVAAVASLISSRREEHKTGA